MDDSLPVETFNETQVMLISLHGNNTFAPFENCDQMVEYVCQDLEGLCTDTCLKDVQENDFLSCGLYLNDDEFQACLEGFKEKGLVILWLD
jgi:hypothetical protein